MDVEVMILSFVTIVSIFTLGIIAYIIDEYKK